ncbi:ABC transporter substrate-binding protein [Streptomyces sp. SID5910]|uniref:ABC transporter substrate-binding protein n=1 Tax=Streptomyces sp. SID5910 TaxID=2690312 RepID=UPI0013706B25|nr:ABC transporter substrate-binding protein [Streptomyces sp. SID5910]MYR44368.1 ABC transporter substrate-binding protein [Streptomyces sp. SID5910]
MSSTRSIRRTALLTGVTVITGALVLSACGGDGDGDGGDEAKPASNTTRQITDALGRKVTVPSAPGKVVTLSEPTLDAALALGVEPVGTTAGRGQKSVSTYLADKAKNAQVVASIAEPDLEKLAALQPDLILLDETTGSKRSVDKLQSIAPTVVTAKLNEDWKKAFTDTADALNKAADAKKWLADFDSEVAATKGQLGDNAGKSVSVIRWQDGAPSVVGKGDGVVGSTLKALGATRPKDQQGASVGHSEPVSLEKLDTIDADWMFFGTLGDKADGDKAYAEARKVANFGKLKAEQAKHVVTVEGSAWNSSGGPLSAEIVLGDIKAALAG